MNLAFDTATFWGRFALAADSALLAYRQVNVSGKYADALLPVIDDLLAEVGRDRGELSVLGVTQGPGSFTGVRIGVATAKGLAYGLGIPLVAVPTLAAMAAALLEQGQDGDLAVPVLDARRGELFAAVYSRRGRWVETVAEPAALPPDVWWERIRAAAVDLEPLVWGGDGVSRLLGQGVNLRPELQCKGAPVLRRWSEAHPATAAALALAMADPAVSLPVFHPFALQPLYLRASDAEVKRHLDLTPQAPDRNFTSRRGRVGGAQP